jgi:hypothetical protein
MNGGRTTVTPVSPFAKRVVATAILVLVVLNAGREGCGQRLAVCAITRVVVVITGDGNGDLRLAVIGTSHGDGDLRIARTWRVCYDSQMGWKSAGDSCIL